MKLKIIDAAKALVIGYIMCIYSVISEKWDQDRSFFGIFDSAIQL